jgi:flagellar motor switch protein FliM
MADTDTTRQGVLGRKIAAARRPAAGAMAAAEERRILTAIARVSEDLMRLPVAAADRRLSERSVAEVVANLPPDGLVVALVADPPPSDGGLRPQGLAVLGPGLVAGLSEWLTLRRLGTGALSPRAPTRADLALAAPWLDAVLGAIAGPANWRVARKIDDPRPLPLKLPEIPLAQQTMTLSLGEGGERSGDLTIAIPLPLVPAGDARRQGGAAGADDPAVNRAPPLDWSAALAQTVGQAGLPLPAVLGRPVLPLGEVMALGPGSVILLPLEAVAGVTLCDAAGRALATGRLGQLRGLKALRVAALAGDKPDGGGAAAPRPAQSAAAPAAAPAPADSDAEAGSTMPAAVGFPAMDLAMALPGGLPDGLPGGLPGASDDMSGGALPMDLPALIG